MTEQHPESGNRRPTRRSGSRPAASRPERSGSRPAAPRPERSNTVQPARRVAYDVLSAVHTDEAYANLLLPVRIRRAALSAADAALATELTYGTLRMSGYYDLVIEAAAGRPVSEIDTPILDVLRLGAHQLLSMRVASHAAVNESVDLAAQVGSRSAVGFTNGVLRGISRTPADEWRTRVLEPLTNPIERLAAEYSHPAWIVRALKQSLTAEGRADELVALLEADNAAPRVNLVALPGLADRATAADPGSWDSYSPVGFASGGGDPLLREDVADGTTRVQDEGSQLAALVLSRARPIVPGEMWLDLCAGPGGKAALLGAEAAIGGATLVANELVPARAELVRQSVKALGDTVTVEVGDGTLVGDNHPELFDRILLDAPCTGLGALRRRPEARWRKNPRDVGELTELQAALIDSAVRALKPGGVLAYVTCSPHQAETRGMVADALRRWPDALTRLDTPAILKTISESELDLGDSGESVQLWPHRHGTDAMFMALLQKTAP